MAVIHELQIITCSCLYLLSTKPVNWDGLLLISIAFFFSVFLSNYILWELTKTGSETVNIYSAQPQCEILALQQTIFSRDVAQ